MGEAAGMCAAPDSRHCHCSSILRASPTTHLAQGIGGRHFPLGGGSLATY